MNIKDVLAKIGKGEELTDEEKALVAAFNPDDGKDDGSDAERLKNAQAKASRLATEKQEQATKLAELEAKLEELSSKDLTDQEKTAKMLERLQGDLEAKNKELEAAQAQMSQATRSHKLDEIHGGVKWNRDNITDKNSRALVQSLLADVEDLTDQRGIDDVLKPWLEESKSFISADVASGSGVQKGQAGGTQAISGSSQTGSTGEAWTPEKINRLSDADFLKPENNIAIWKAANDAERATHSEAAPMEVI